MHELKKTNTYVSRSVKGKSRWMFLILFTRSIDALDLIRADHSRGRASAFYRGRRALSGRSIGHCLDPNLFRFPAWLMRFHVIRVKTTP